MSPDSIFKDAAGFRLSTATWLVQLAELVYEPPAVAERALRDEWGCHRLKFIDVECTQCLVATRRATTVVAFRGTEQRLEDWVTDLDFDLVKGPLDGKVHAGFYDGLSKVWHVLSREVRRQRSAGQRLLVTGHSLGGALASLAVARWLEADVPVNALYTFGQPRVGDRTFARHFDLRFRGSTFRIVNHRDIVTRTPPRSFGYYHLGSFVYFNDQGQMAQDIGWWRRFLTGWQGTIESILDWGREGLEDHRLSEYRGCLERLRALQPTLPVPLPTLPASSLPAPAAVTDPLLDRTRKVFLTRPRRAA